MSVQYNFGRGGYDLHFTMPALSINQWVAVQCDSAFTESDQDETAPIGTVKLKRTDDGFEVSLLDTNGNVLEQYAFEHAAKDQVNRVRVRVRNEAVSVSLNEWWAVTLWLKQVRHAEQPAVYLLASGAIEVSEIRLVELADGQDQVQVDVEDSSANAIAAVIQRRPIFQWCLEDGSMRFSYDPPEALHEVLWAWKVDQNHDLSDRAASDGLVYHREGVAVVIDDEALEEIGLVTRTVRYSELEHGAIRAGHKLLERGRQALHRTTLTRALIPHLETYDQVHYEALIGGGVVGVEGTCLAEKVTFNITGAVAQMTIEGRAA